MKNVGALVFVFVVFAWAGGAVAQNNISVTSLKGQSVNTVLHDYLIGGGVYVYNCKFNEDSTNVVSAQLGHFTANNFKGLQMDEGLVITTGDVKWAVGPNNSSSAGGSTAGYVTDSKIGKLISGTSATNCAVIDFDFVSISPYVTVNYVFGSEEYPEYVCSSFNDVFAFLVSGPDPSTGVSKEWNAATLPHTESASKPNGIAVTINSVNIGEYGKSSGNGNGSGCYYDYADFYVDNSNGDDYGGGGASGVQYDGYTQKLSANAKLTPCEVYHMHIGVCNASDQAFDSGVFLELNSFNSPSADIDLSHREADTVERSKGVELPLSISGSVYNTANVSVSFGGTAQPGVDYTCTTLDGKQLNTVYTTFTIENDTPNQLTFKGTPTADLKEPKLIELYLSTSLCDEHPELKTHDTIRYTLVEDDLLRLVHDTIVAYDTCYDVGVEVAIGTPPFTFHWNPEDDIDFPYQQYSTAHITESRLYVVSATDAKGHTDSTEVYVEVRPKEGIDEVGAPRGPMVWPNPATGGFNVDMSGALSLTVYNAQGVLVCTRRGGGQARVDGLEPGLYTVRLDYGTGSRTEKVVVQ